MKHPMFQPGETCYAVVPTSDGVQLIECEIIEGLVHRSIRDLEGRHICYALAYKVLLDGAVMEIPMAERDLRKKFERRDWGMMRNTWQPEHIRNRQAPRVPAWKVWR